MNFEILQIFEKAGNILASQSYLEMDMLGKAFFMSIVTTILIIMATIIFIIFFIKVKRESTNLKHEAVKTKITNNALMKIFMHINSVNANTCFTAYAMQNMKLKLLELEQPENRFDPKYNIFRKKIETLNAKLRKISQHAKNSIASWDEPCPKHLRV